MQDENNPMIEELHLSVRSYNGLRRGGYRYISEILDLQKEDLLQLKNIGAGSADEIFLALQQYRERAFGPQDTNSQSEIPAESKRAAQTLAEIPIFELDLSVRGYHGLMKSGIETVGQLALMSEEEIGTLKNIGKGTAAEIIQKLNLFTAAFYDEMLPSDATENTSADKRTIELAKELQTIWGRTLSYWTTVIDQLPEPVDRTDRNAILSAIYRDPRMYSVQENETCRYIESQNDKCGIAEISASLHIPEPCVKDVLRRLLDAGKIRLEEDLVCRVYPSILDYAETLKDKQKLYLLQKLEGKTLEEIGIANARTRERVRQIIEKALKDRPRLAEDRYLPLFEQYECSLEDFCLAFGEQPYVYYYLELAADRVKNRKSLMDAEDDDSLPVEMRRGAEKAAYKNYLHMDGVRVKKTRPDLVQYYIRKHCKEKTSYADFETGYQSFLEQQGLGGDSSLTLNSRTYENRFAEDNRSVLWSRGKQFRYYEIDEIDKSAFIEALHLDRFKDVSISTLLLFRDYPELMQENDIRDEYELHNLLKKLVGSKNGEMEFSKMPTVNFGKPDRGAQALEILLLHAPISANDLAVEYEKAYGFQAASALSNDFKAIGEYFHNGMYTIDSPALPPEHFERLKHDLTEDYYTIGDIRDHYEKNVPGADLKYINPYSLKTLGFHVYDGYVVSNRFDNAIDYFRMLLRKDDIVDLSAFPKSILDNGTFTGLRYDLEREHELMECSPTLLLSIRRLEAAGYAKAEIQSYCDAVAAWIAPGAFVTVTFLRNSGFTHPLEDLGFDDWFYASLIWMDPRFRSMRIGGTRLSILEKRQPSFEDLLLDILQSHGNRMDIYELRSYLEEQYGIVLDKDKLAFLIRKSDMYYDSIMEAAYTDYDTYYEEI